MPVLPGVLEAQIYSLYLGTSSLHEGTSGSPTWTALNGSGKGANSDWTRYAYFEPTKGIPIEYTAQPVGQRSGVLRLSDEVYAGAWAGVLHFRSVYGGTDTGAALQAERMEEWGQLADLMATPDGEVYLRFDYTDRAAASISRTLAVQLSEIRQWHEDKTGRDNQAGKRVEAAFVFDVLYPYYCERAGSSQAFANAKATAATASVTNGGMTDQLGLALEVDTVNSTTTVVTITNTTTGKALVWTVATNFTAGDRLSFFADDPRVIALTTTNASHLGASSADGDAFLARGSNDLEITSNGDIDVTAYWYAERFTV